MREQTQRRSRGCRQANVTVRECVLMLSSTRPIISRAPDRTDRVAAAFAAETTVSARLRPCSVEEEEEEEEEESLLGGGGGAGAV